MKTTCPVASVLAGSALAGQYEDQNHSRLQGEDVVPGAASCVAGTHTRSWVPRLVHLVVSGNESHGRESYHVLAQWGVEV
jgi:hypothetical protein